MVKDDASALLADFVEILLFKDEDFLVIKETLQRIGIPSKRSRTLFQSCHILHKRGHYFIVHFKEMFKLDGKETDMSESDYARRNTIANLLEEWKLLELVDKNKSSFPLSDISEIKILTFQEKKSWELVPKYQIGSSK